ncbi:hypothetical protein GBAR_LOCUS10865 [Geodia barretti]|uniref:Uncharacterized protein n=1 Tax=Geodia barretti TaxID=519541 RepID=A0AA35RW48_GEOBA|nr:hypothetical protein GBAR_LOCUS10865 [Geodia barretti]
MAGYPADFSVSSQRRQRV